MLSKELLDILACPSCKGDLEYDQKNEKLICHGEHCPKCGYPIKEKSVDKKQPTGKQDNNQKKRGTILG